MAKNHVKPYRRTALCEELRGMIRERKLWGQRLSGQRELASEFGVARRTLELALGELEAEGLIERRHGSGTFVSDRPRQSGRKRTCRVAILAERHSELAAGWDYYGEMIRGMQAAGSRLNAECEVLAMNVPEERERMRDRREMLGFDGFVSIAVDDRITLSHLLALRKRPVVLLDHYVRDLPVSSVVDGSFEGMRAVTRHVLRLGHRRVAFLDCHNRDAVNPEKFAGYRTALEENGIPLDEELVDIPATEELSELPTGVVDSAVERLLELKDPPTALVCFSDEWAVPAIGALEKRGLRVGADIAVASHGDGAYRKGKCDWLTSCRIYPRKMGRLAARAALESERCDEARTIICPNRLYVRRSSCPPRG